MSGRLVLNHRPDSLTPTYTFVSTWNILAYTPCSVPVSEGGEAPQKKIKKTSVTPLQSKRQYDILCLVKPTEGGQVKDNDEEGVRR